MATLSKDDVLKLARLARLELSDEEVSEFSIELNQILHFVDQLKDVDTEGLSPTNQVTGLVNVTREDEEKNYGYDPGDLLKNVPEIKGNQIKTGRMVE